MSCFTYLYKHDDILETCCQQYTQSSFMFMTFKTKNEMR